MSGRSLWVEEVIPAASEETQEMTAERRAFGIHRFEFNESPVYWFARYEGAISKRQFSMAREAKDRLRDLGYNVNTIDHPASSKGKVKS